MTAEVFALFVAGIVASPFIQFIKERLHWVGWQALWLSWALCVVLASLALLFTGELKLTLILSDPITLFAELGQAFAMVIGLATIIYKAKFDQPA